MLSNPAAESSGGSSDAASTSSASRSRMALLYSARFSRCSAGVPANGFAAAARSICACRAVTKLVDRRTPGTRRTGRRHHPGLQLADDLFPGLRMAIDLREVRRIEREPPGFRARVVAGDAVPGSAAPLMAHRRPEYSARGVWLTPVTDAAVDNERDERREQRVLHVSAHPMPTMTPPAASGSTPSSTAWPPVSSWRGTRLRPTSSACGLPCP